MQERTGKQQKNEAHSEDVGAMLRKEQESGDRQQYQKGDARSRRQEATFGLRLLVYVVMVRHIILSYAIKYHGAVSGYLISIKHLNFVSAIERR